LLQKGGKEGKTTSEGKNNSGKSVSKSDTGAKKKSEKGAGNPPAKKQTKDTKKSKKDTKKSKKDTKKSKKDTKKSKKDTKKPKKGTSTSTPGTGTTPTTTTPTSTSTVTATPTGSTSSIQCPLKSASKIVVLGGATVTSTGPSILTGGVVSPSITGFPPGIINGVQHVNDAVASQAKTDLTAAITSLNAPACGVSPQAPELGGTTLTPKVYCFSSSAQITGSLTLDAQGNPNAQWIFRIPSTLTTAAGARIVLTNGALACNIFFCGW